MANGSLKQPKIGDLVHGKGVYIGRRELEDWDGRPSLGMFDLYAAPEDLRDDRGERLLLTVDEAFRNVAGLRQYHGHDGASYENDGALYEAIRSGHYQGEWFIPPENVLKENLFGNSSKGALAGTFAVARGGYDNWYWSSTQLLDADTERIRITMVRTMDAGEYRGRRLGAATRFVANDKDVALSCRPVRAEPASSPV